MKQRIFCAKRNFPIQVKLFFKEILDENSTKKNAPIIIFNAFPHLQKDALKRKIRNQSTMEGTPDALIFSQKEEQIISLIAQINPRYTNSMPAIAPIVKKEWQVTDITQNALQMNQANQFPATLDPIEIQHIGLESNGETVNDAEMDQVNVQVPERSLNITQVRHSQLQAPNVTLNTIETPAMELHQREATNSTEEMSHSQLEVNGRREGASTQIHQLIDDSPCSTVDSTLQNEVILTCFI